MKYIQMMIIAFFASTTLVATGFAAEKEFDSEKMLSELESQLELSSEKMSKLKPAIDAKSEELKKSMHEAVDKGFVELGELTNKLDAMSKDAEQKVKEFLNSEEMAELKNYLSRVDEEAVREVKDRLIAELTAVLELTEEQIIKLKPILEDSLAQLSEMLEKLSREGSRNWDDFKHQYEELIKELRKKLESTLDNIQIQRFDKYNEEKKEKIRTNLFTV